MLVTYPRRALKKSRAARSRGSPRFLFPGPLGHTANLPEVSEQVKRAVNASAPWTISPARACVRVRLPGETEIREASAGVGGEAAERFFSITYSSPSKNCRLKNYRTISFRSVRFDE